MKKHETKYLKDYLPPVFLVDSIDLDVMLHEDCADVNSRLHVTRNPQSALEKNDFYLDGTALELIELSIDNRVLAPEEYIVCDESLTLLNVPESFILDVKTRINPRENTSLEGLYKSGAMFCTQCEAEGFRKITYFPDRPDVMSKYSCRIEADSVKYPVLLSNGNLVEKGLLENGRHYAIWEDPFKKPCYLFALVAGDLVKIEDRYTTASGRNVALEIFVEAENADKCDHAMASLKKAMKWDEENFGREYDLDIYMIVAVNDFNMGAMENKGLNIFNSKYVLARPETATDADFEGIEGVVAHEYFHNWTGNRVTLNSWFQLSLKEGLTVFRDQQFTADMTSKAVKRITDVKKLRAAQFPEDAGPMAHPVRPESYIEMNNFYTMTVYEKGAEVIRMIHTLTGADGFRKGMALYFQRFDGKAVSTEDFVRAMEDATGTNLDQFRLWYSQAGTPVVSVRSVYDEAKQEFAMTFSQSVPDTPGQTGKKSMHIPVSVGLIGSDGKEIGLQLDGEDEPGGTTRVLNLKKQQETFTFKHIAEKPVPSVLRNFSAPVIPDTDLSTDDLIFLMANDSDPFNRWDAAQTLYFNLIEELVEIETKGGTLHVPEKIIEAVGKTLADTSLDRALISKAVSVPSENEIGDSMKTIDVERICRVRDFVVTSIASGLKDLFVDVYSQNRNTDDKCLDKETVSKRMLKNSSLYFLGAAGGSDAAALAYKQFETSANMTDTVAALSILSDIDCPERQAALDSFYARWSSDTLVLDKWFIIQASSKLEGTLENVESLLAHPAFSIKNPNKVRSLVGVFASSNMRNFHHRNGKGYRFLSDRIIELNSLNPQIASRMAGIFNRWKKFDGLRQGMMKKELERIREIPDLSRDVYEIVSKALV